MEFLAQYGLFLAEAVTIVVAILVVAGFLFAMGQRQRIEEEGHIEIRKLNERYQGFREAMQHAILSEDESKQKAKQDKKREKQEGNQELVRRNSHE